ncbi:hypothetical protein PFBG_03769 [Plasmodium falciparum 7G8]|uniref:Uncharacterized protein n=1 Tax=Plasmodium falciparum (isolate 7G8) TaxID=57266 RepID=W7F4R6_PLAF8|nr:hypothetical protein PFBG_03769 [Plasmodium falciparum 7G8]
MLKCSREKKQKLCTDSYTYFFFYIFKKNSSTSYLKCSHNLKNKAKNEDKKKKKCVNRIYNNAFFYIIRFFYSCFFKYIIFNNLSILHLLDDAYIMKIKNENESTFINSNYI